MRLEEAKATAAHLARRERRTWIVAYDPCHQSPGWRHRYIVLPEAVFMAHITPHFYVAPTVHETPVHHHARQDGSGGQSFVGRKRDCPLCHPRKSKGAR